MVLAALAASWCATVFTTPLLGRLDELFAPKWLLWALTGGAVLFAAATTMSSVAVMCIVATAPTILGVISAAALGALFVLGCSRAARHGQRVSASLHAGKVFRYSRSRCGDVLVIDDAQPDAFAVPGRRAVVVITTGLRAALSADEFDAVIRHERAHLRARHYLFTHATEFAACLNPLLWRWPDVVRFAAERHADECAAELGRPVTAQAVARAALLCACAGRSATSLPIADHAGEVVRRVRALRRDRPVRQRGWSAAIAVTVLAATAANVAMTADLAQDRLAPEPGEAASVVLW